MDTPPPTHLLSYFAAATTPTRVRSVAAATLLWFALFHLAIAVTFSLLIAYAHAHQPYYRWYPFDPWLDNLQRICVYLYQEQPVASASTLLTLAVTPAAALLSPFVRRGRTRAASLALFLVIPSLLLTVPLTALLGAIAIGFAWGLSFASHSQPLFILLLLPTLLLIPWIVLLKDLTTFLRWIACNPATEKPPTPFLPPPRYHPEPPSPPPRKTLT